MVVLYNWLGKRAASGDTVAASIWIDVRNAIYGEPKLRKKLLEVVELISHNYMLQEEAARELQIAQSNVSRRFNRAIKFIFKKLNSGKMYRGGCEIMADSGLQEDSTEIEVTNKIRCGMCCNEFTRSEMFNSISLYDGSYIYRCSRCFEKWRNRDSNSYKNRAMVVDDREYCPKCHVKLTEEGRCVMNC